MLGVVGQQLMLRPFACSLRFEYAIRVVAYLFENGGKNLRNQKDPDTCGRD